MLGRSRVTSASALMLLAAAIEAQAQSGQQGSNQPVEEFIPDIVVMATRVATNLQSTPIAITAVTAESLQERGITQRGRSHVCRAQLAVPASAGRVRSRCVVVHSRHRLR